MNNEEKYEVIELLGLTALFTEERIDDSYVPDGLYKYELREGDGLDFYYGSIEKHVTVNHVGTILVGKAIDLGTEGYIAFDDLTDDDYPGFEGKEMTVGEYISTCCK